MDQAQSFAQYRWQGAPPIPSLHTGDPLRIFCHVRVTSPMDACVSQGSDLDLRTRPGPAGHPETASTTCAMWCPGRDPRSGQVRLPARRSGIAGCRSVRHSPELRSHIPQILTRLGRIPMQSVPRCGRLTKILCIGLHVPSLGGGRISVPPPRAAGLARRDRPPRTAVVPAPSTTGVRSAGLCRGSGSSPVRWRLRGRRRGRA